MSAVVSIRIPQKLKEHMDKIKDKIDWSREIRSFIEYKIKEYERLKAIEEVHKVIEKLPETPLETAAKYVREDRDSH